MRAIRAAARADLAARLLMFVLSLAVVLLVIAPLAVTLHRMLARLVLA